jgi:hypothetical protein
MNEDHIDYLRFLSQHGLSEIEVRKMSEFSGDLIPMPSQFDSLEIRVSEIEGLGMFAKVDIRPWQLIAPVRVNEKRTPAGRYVNHSAKPNAFFVRLENGDLDLVSAALIQAGEEIVIDYRQALNANTDLSEALHSKAVSMLDQMPTVESVRALENVILQFPQTDFNTSNVVHGDMCARTIFIPKGTILTGALTNVKNIMISSGDITVTTDEGTKRLTGFHVIKATAGNKRAGIAHADTYVTMVWPTKLTNIEEIEDELTDESAMLQTRRKGIVYDKPNQIGVTK